MTTPEDTSQKNPTAEQVDGVLVLLLAGAAVGATAASVARLLKLPVTAVLPVLLMMRKTAPKLVVSNPTPKAGPGVQSATKPTQITSDANNLYRSAFLVNSSQRVAAADDPKAQLAREQQFWQAHVAASNRRLFMAKAAEEAQKKHGDLLGWYTTLDARTSDECRAADGRNFYAAKPPVIGYPGSVHLYCRCTPGPPHPGAKQVDASSIVRLSPEASGFEKRSGDA